MEVNEFLQKSELDRRKWDLASNLIIQNCRDMYIDEPMEKFERIVKQCIDIAELTIKLYPKNDLYNNI